MSITPEIENRLRQGFKALNRFMILLWRLGLGNWLNAWPQVLGRYLVLTHTGRKTGIARRTPINFARVTGEIYCVAGFGQVSDWYRNTQANPRVEVWLPDGWWEGVVEDLSDSNQRIPLLREVLIASGFAAILFGVNPHQLTDPELDTVTRPYRLLHIQLERPRTGLHGPGDLAWVWPLTVMLMVPFLFRRIKGRLQ